MTTTTMSFAGLLRQFRLRMKKSQQELSDDLKSQGVKLYSSDISKLERGERRPPKMNDVLVLISTLHLTEEEIQTFLEAGNYPPKVLNLAQEQMKQQQSKTSTTPIYPPNTEEQGLKYLLGDFPSWQCREDGELIAFNRTIMWLFMATLTTDFMGKHIFEVFTRPWNFTRIVLTGELNDFWIVKLQVLKWLEKEHPSPELERAKSIILANLALKIIYENLGKMNLEGTTFYEYTLHIQHPEMQNHYLHFLVKISVVRKLNGDIEKFIVVYEPNDPYTTEVIAKKSQELRGNEDYIYQASTIVQTKQKTQEHRFPPSYPSITHDPFFTITAVNEAMRNMIASLAHNYNVEPVKPVGMNFFELVFSDPLKLPVEALGEWTAAVQRAIEGLKYTMQLHLKAHPEDKEKYQRKIAGLKENLKGFADLYDTRNYKATFPETTEPFYACTVSYLPSPQADKSSPVTIDSWVLNPNYQERNTLLITFVPHDDASKKLLDQLLEMAQRKSKNYAGRSNDGISATPH